MLGAGYPSAPRLALLFEQLAIEGLVEDVLAGAAIKAARAAGPPGRSGRMLAILGAFRRFPAERVGDPLVRTPAEVVSLADLLDEELELLAWLPAGALTYRASWKS
jgi:hypothetical protein